MIRPTRLSTSSPAPSSFDEQDETVDVALPPSPSPPQDDENNSNRYQLKPAKSICLTGVAPREGALNEAVAAVLASSDMPCTLAEANELISWGAVWARMERLTEADLLALYDEDDSGGGGGGGESSSARALYADLPSSDDGPVDLDEYVKQMNQQRFRRILTPSQVDAGTDLRIYPKPRRFPSCYDMTRETNLLYEDTTFIVVDKPAMLPTQPDASNYHECCPGCVQSQMGPFQVDINGEPFDKRPNLCHRVDACVSGCVVLPKDRNGQRVFAQLQRDRQLRKLYLAVTREPVPLGMHVHWMWAPQTQRGAVGGPPCQLVRHSVPESRRQARQFWNRCVLEVVKCERVVVPDTAFLSMKHCQPRAQNDSYYQSTIRLVTGRKHQVRAQLASLGAPIIGDTLYEPVAGLTLDALHGDEDDESEIDARIAHCRAPNAPIGLQAAGILFGGVKARAHTPWWGDGGSTTTISKNDGSSTRVARGAE